MLKIANATCYNTEDLAKVVANVHEVVQTRWSHTGRSPLDFSKMTTLFEYARDEVVRYDRASTVGDDLLPLEGGIVAIVYLPRRKFLKPSALEELANMGQLILPDVELFLLRHKVYLATVSNDMRKIMQCPTLTRAGSSYVNSSIWPHDPSPVRVMRRASANEKTKARWEAVKVKYNYVITRAMRFEIKSVKPEWEAMEITAMTEKLTIEIEGLRQAMRGVK